jgi:predicted transcriptional regulator
MKKRRLALSIRQPFVEQIFNGNKQYEYRATATNIRGRVYIYASKTNLSTLPLPTGVIVGTVEIIDCWRDSMTGYVWRLGNPKRLKRPLKPKNKPQPVWFKPF